MTTPHQLSLFPAVLHAYKAENDGRLDNATLYREVAAAAGLPEEAFAEKVAIGKSGQMHSLLGRAVRWHQQTLKAAGILRKVDGERGWWELTHPARKGLSEVAQGVALVGYSTDLGVAILGHCDHVFASVDSPISLILTSPPYPLAKERAYGNVHMSVYIDWLIKTIEPVVRNMADGASLCLNVSNDKILAGSPARSTYLERLTLALEDRLGLQLMDRLIWSNPCKPPSPVRYASIDRTQLNAGWEPILWMTNNPFKVKSNNTRVLQTHSDRHMKLMQQGGEQRFAVNSDGAYTIRPGSYGNVTPGKIPRNVLQFGHTCADQRAYKQACRNNGLPAHGAPMPLALAKFLIEFLTIPGEIVADPFSGSGTTAKAAELLGRRWLATEIMAEYLLGSAYRFVDARGFQMQMRMAA